jgi:hypothetical protein
MKLWPKPDSNRFLPAHAREDAPDTAKNEGLCPIEQQYYKWECKSPGNRRGRSDHGQRHRRGPGAERRTPGDDPRRPSQGNDRHYGQQGVRLGHEAIALAAATIKAGDNEVVVAGGMENMSDVPIVCPKPAGDTAWICRSAKPST